MLEHPKQNIRRGVVEVQHKNGSRENAVYSWDVTDQQAAQEGAAIEELIQLRPDMDIFNNIV